MCAAHNDDNDDDDDDDDDDVDATVLKHEAHMAPIRAAVTHSRQVCTQQRHSGTGTLQCGAKTRFWRERHFYVWNEGLCA